MHLKERLSQFNKDTQSMTDYLQAIKVMSNELTVINSPLDNVDLIIHTLNDLKSEFKEIIVSLRTRESHMILMHYTTF